MPLATRGRRCSRCRSAALEAEHLLADRARLEARPRPGPALGACRCNSTRTSCSTHSTPSRALVPSATRRACARVVARLSSLLRRVLDSRRRPGGAAPRRGRVPARLPRRAARPVPGPAGGSRRTWVAGHRSTRWCRLSLLAAAGRERRRPRRQPGSRSRRSGVIRSRRRRLVGSPARGRRWPGLGPGFAERVERDGGLGLPNVREPAWTRSTAAPALTLNDRPTAAGPSLGRAPIPASVRSEPSAALRARPQSGGAPARPRSPSTPRTRPSMPDTPLRVLVVDDEPLARQRVLRPAGAEPDGVEVVGEAGTGRAGGRRRSRELAPTWYSWTSRCPA